MFRVCSCGDSRLILTAIKVILIAVTRSNLGLDIYVVKFTNLSSLKELKRLKVPREQAFSVESNTAYSICVNRQLPAFDSKLVLIVANLLIKLQSYIWPVIQKSAVGIIMSMSLNRYDEK